MYQRSGGWAAGLTLLLEQRGETRTIPIGADAGAPQALVDYFSAEVFDRASGDVRTLWLRTAYLPRFTADMARKLSGNDKAGKLLDTLYRQRYFTDRRTASAPHYQYHALFRELLSNQIERIYTAAERQQLAHRSARALAKQGDHDAALALYREANDWESVQQLILQQAPILFGQGRWQTLLTWLAGLQRTMIEENPWLAFWFGSCEAQRNPGAGRAILEQAHARFVETQDVLGQAFERRRSDRNLLRRMG